VSALTGLSLPPTLVFDHPSVLQIAQHVVSLLPAPAEPAAEDCAEAEAEAAEARLAAGAPVAAGAPQRRQRSSGRRAGSKRGVAGVAAPPPPQTLGRQRKLELVTAVVGGGRILCGPFQLAAGRRMLVGAPPPSACWMSPLSPCCPDVATTRLAACTPLTQAAPGLSPAAGGGLRVPRDAGCCRGGRCAAHGGRAGLAGS
jgi:hypothetical protein